MVGVARRRRWRAGLVAAAAVVVGGCGGGASPSNQAQDLQFLASVHSAAPDVSSYRNDVQQIRLGHAACDGFRSGVSYQQLADRLPQTEGRDPLPPGDLGAVITSAVHAYCPAYLNQVG